MSVWGGKKKSQEKEIMESFLYGFPMATLL